MEDYEKSLDTLQRLLDDEVEKSSYYYKSKMIQGVIFYKLKKTTIAIDIFYNLLNDKDLDSDLIFRIYNNIALCYIDEKKYIEAEKFLDKAIERADEERRFKHEVLGDKGSLYFELERYEEAKDFLNKSVEISEEIGNYKYQLEGLKLLYKIYFEEKDESEQEKILIRILNVANDTGSKDEIIWSMKRLIDLAVKQKDLNKVKIFNDYIKD